MNDNNDNLVNEEEKLPDEKKATSVFLKELVIEFEEKLYSIKVELKNQTNLLNEKVREQADRERTKIHNLDLFSPIHNKTVEKKDVSNSIDQIKNEIDNLQHEEQLLYEKITGLKVAVGLLDNRITEDTTEEKVSGSRYMFSDKGLSILEAQEVERQRIANELHDTTVQNLTSMVHKSELCIKLIDIDPIRAKLELTAMSNTVKSVINDMRGIIYNLKPMSLDDLGLTVTIERYANKIRDLFNIHVEVNSNSETKEILPVIKLTLFRIIQEACHNVVKHANATIIFINIVYDEHNITVSIKDNGTGFNMIQKTETTGQSSSFGLSIMNERISLLSGTVEIHSEAGKGTIVTIFAPLTVYEGEKNE